MLVTRGNVYFFVTYDITRERLTQVFFGILFFNVLWGFVWYGVKTLLLKYLAGFSKEERRQSFSSRMREPFDVAAFVRRGLLSLSSSPCRARRSSSSLREGPTTSRWRRRTR